ncbi:sterol 14-demethylase [Litorivivens lipolytica]|uniref:Sterol 14-demethylase n=1 Tax=Litorivivens lipolytica TaxID=1524264 RepID=A0A7W4Z845_9GAMM|nr:cytochrome P450 [Litorivivens lipolytica]MBB3048571.1 sterol 14-demethylase [Litorivivens lipolytica]
MSTQAVNTSKTIPVASGAQTEGGHYLEFINTPLAFMRRVFEECGEVGQFDMGGLPTVLMIGPEAHEAFFRAPDDQLSASEAYQMMVPVFGEGVQYGAEPHIERQQLKIQYQGLKHDKMSSYAGVVAQEVIDFTKDWGDEGEMDFYEAFTDLTLRTSTHCLLGSVFRYRLTDEFADLYRDLENGIDPSALLDPNQQKETFKKRDIARERLQELITEEIHRRRDAEAKGEEPLDDMLNIYMTAEYEDGRKLTEHEITGLVIWFMFAGHHTSSNTSAWTLVEIARHPQYHAELVGEIDKLFDGGQELSFNALREIPLLEGFIREALRLHPPLNAISRRVMKPFQFKDYLIEPGCNVMLCPWVAHKLPEYFPNPETFDPKRPAPDNVFAAIPFGGGRRKCVGNAFALLQVKAIFCELLRNFEFELTMPAEDYQEIMPALILRPSDPCTLRYKRRKGV